MSFCKHCFVALALLCVVRAEAFTDPLAWLVEAAVNKISPPFTTQAPLACPDPPSCPTRAAVTSPSCPDPTPCPLCATPQPLEPACPSGWTYYGPTGKCYQAVCNVAATDASGSCQKLNATLMSAHNLVDNNWLYHFGLSNCPTIGYWSGSMWLGIFDVQFSQNWAGYNWQWADGTAVDFTNWSRNQPNGYGSGRCVSTNGREDAFGLWDDSDCSIQMQAAVCQMNPQ